MATTAGGVQEIQVTVKGGYIPETVVARPGIPLRILFRREETSPCSEEVVFADFGIRRQLAAFETTAVEIPASAAGSYGFACGMDMMHGRLVLAESPAAVASLPAMPAPSAEWPIDPICGMKVNPEKAAGTSQKNGVTYYFCNPGCKDRFDRGEGPRTMMAASEHRVTLGVRRKA
jgi:YHS domain-containing protein